MVTSVLQALGLNEAEERLYKLLLGRQKTTGADAAREMGLPARNVRTLLAALESKGLVGRSPGRQPEYVPVPPDLGLEALLLKREAELRHARLEKDRLLEQFLNRIQPRVTRTVPLDLVRGPEATRQRWVQIQRSATEEVRILDRPPYVMSPSSPNSEELALLSARVRYRVLYDETSFDVPGKLDSARTCVAAGEQARVIAGVPMKLVVGDRRLALTHDFLTGGVQDGLVIHPSSLLESLILLFDMLWERAIPFNSESASTPFDEFDDIDRIVIALLASGGKDESIARRVGQGVRTVRRRIAHLLDVLGARTRFEAGVKCAQLGWTGPSGSKEHDPRDESQTT